MEQYWREYVTIKIQGFGYKKGDSNPVYFSAVKLKHKASKRYDKCLIVLISHRKASDVREQTLNTSLYILKQTQQVKLASQHQFACIQIF